MTAYCRLLRATTVHIALLFCVISCTASSGSLRWDRVVVEVFNNTAFAGKPEIVDNLDNLSRFQSVRIQSSLVPPNQQQHQQQWLLFHLGIDAGYARLWIDHHLMVDSWAQHEDSQQLLDASYALPIPFVPSNASLLQLDLTIWDSIPTYINLFANSTGWPLGEWMTPHLPHAERVYLKERAENEKGWNTWLSTDMLSHVLLPHGLAVSLVLEHNGTRISNIGGPSCNPKVFPVKHGLHDTRGEYTEIEQVWVGDNATVRVESANFGEYGMVLVVSPVNGGAVNVDVNMSVPSAYLPRTCRIEQSLSNHEISGFCPGLDEIHVKILDNTIVKSNRSEGMIRATTTRHKSVIIVAHSNHEKDIVPSTAEQAIRLIFDARQRLVQRLDKRHNETHAGLVAAISWNVIYTPYEGIITPIFRGSPWVVSQAHDYVLFEWDTYLASIMAAFVGDTWVATNNIVRMTQTLWYQGFVPGFWNGRCGELDKSKPPLGAMALQYLLQHDPSKNWVADLIVDHLVEWNGWWTRQRMPRGHYLIAPGSTQANVNLTAIDCADAPPVHAARCETGLDNSPLYDTAKFIHNVNMIDQLDIGMSALYVQDCTSLVKIATRLGRHGVANRMQQRARLVTRHIESTLWNKEEEIYMNKRWTDGQWLPRDKRTLSYPLAPTSFYPLLTRIPTDEQVNGMILRYLGNASEFAVSKGIKYGMPSVSRSSSAFPNNNYWRGRSWGPMNFLVYMGLQKYSHLELVQTTMSILAQQSNHVFLKEWIPNRRVMENYNSETGQGCDVSRANSFYHWGALNALIALTQAKTNTGKLDLEQA